MRSDSPSAQHWVLFDVGGVLIRWDDSRTFRTVARRYGLEPDDVKGVLERQRRKLQSGEITIHEFWARFARSFALPLPEDWRTLWSAQMGRLARPKKQVLGLASQLRRRGVPTGLFSNTDPTHWRVLHSRGWFEGFSPQIVSFRLGAVKPDPEAFHRAEKLFPSTVGMPLLVDDSAANVRAARAAGWDAIWFTSESALRCDLRRRGLLNPE